MGGVHYILQRMQAGVWVDTFTRYRESIDLEGAPVWASWLEEEALANIRDGEHVIQIAVAFTSFQFWTQFAQVDLAPAELTRLKVKILEYALKAARQV